MLKRLLPLALATFAVGTDAYVIAGLLPSIATDLDVSTPAAGQLVTVFALVLAVSAPVTGAITSGVDRRAALLIALSVFVVGNAITALGTSYEAVMIALWAVAGLGLVAAVGIAAGLPKVTLPATSLADRLRPLKQGRVLSLLAVTALVFLGAYVLYTYIGPALQNATAGSGSRLTVILLAWGVGTLAGNLTAGWLVDRYNSAHVLTAALVVAIPTLALTPVVTNALVPALAWALVWGVTVGVVVVPQQHRLLVVSPAAAPVLLGLNSSAISFGIALGGGLGGLAQESLDLAPAQLGLPAAGVTALVLLCHLTTARSLVSTPPMAVTRG